MEYYNKIDRREIHSIYIYTRMLHAYVHVVCTYMLFSCIYSTTFHQLLLNNTTFEQRSMEVALSPQISIKKRYTNR